MVGKGDQDMTTRDIVEQFQAAWTRGDERATRALMADDLSYENPLHRYGSAEALLPGLMRFAGMMRCATTLSLVVDGDRAALLYDCDVPAPIGMLRTAWFVRVEHEKVRSIQSVFDCTEIRKLEV